MRPPFPLPSPFFRFNPVVQVIFEKGRLGVQHRRDVVPGANIPFFERQLLARESEGDSSRYHNLAGGCSAELIFKQQLLGNDSDCCHQVTITKPGLRPLKAGQKANSLAL